MLFSICYNLYTTKMIQENYSPSSSSRCTSDAEWWSSGLIGKLGTHFGVRGRSYLGKGVSQCSTKLLPIHMQYVKINHSSI